MKTLKNIIAEVAGNMLSDSVNAQCSDSLGLVATYDVVIIIPLGVSP